MTNLINPSISLLLPSSQEMKEYDQFTIQNGITSLELVEKAGKALCENILLKEDSKKILVLCGGGNNGADGAVLARLLLAEGKDVNLVIADCQRYSDELLKSIENFILADGKVQILPSDTFTPPSFDYSILTPAEFVELVRNSDLVIDALLGTGQRDQPKRSISILITLTNKNLSQFAKIISLDVPTGINCDSGVVYEDHFSPNRCICIEYIKRGLMQSPAFDEINELDVVSIGIKANKESEFSLLDESCKALIKERKRSDHKGVFGRLLVIGGSEQMPGAPTLVARAALRTGAGVVVQTVLNSPVFIAGSPEIIYLPINQSFFTLEALSIIKEKINNFNAIVIGPGIGTDSETITFIANFFEILATTNIPVVIDADAINLLARLRGDSLLTLPNAIITPHPKEASRLLSCSIDEIQDDRYASVKELYRITQSTIVLKGASSVVWNDNMGFVNISGTPYMATAGSGDVLSGMIGSFLAQGYSLSDSARLGVYLHGQAGEDASLKRGGVIIASDIIESIRV